MAGYSLRNNFLLPVTVSVTPEKPYTSRAVTTVTLFLNSLREKKEKAQRGKEKEIKRQIYIKNKLRKVVTVVTGRDKRSYIKGFRARGVVTKSVTSCYGTCYYPPTLDETQGQRHTAVGVHFSPEGTKTFSRQKAR